MSRPASDRFLLGDSLQPSSKAKYISALRNFVNWCFENRYVANSFEQLDELLADYIHYLFEVGEGSGKGEACCLVYGVIKFLPRSKFELLTAQACLAGWLKKFPSIPYPPLTWPLSVAISVQLLRMYEPRAAIGVLLAFDCFLRCGELVNLHAKDVADAGDHRLGTEYSGMALRLRKTKTGSNQWVEVDDPAVKLLVRVLLQSCPSKRSLLFPFTSSHFRSLFKQAVQSLGLQHNYIPHSLRHGGATRWHLLGRSMEDIMVRGRWASSKSARRYVQSGRALLLSLHIPEAVAVAAQVFADNLLSTFSFALSQLH
jgi:integrase